MERMVTVAVRGKPTTAPSRIAHFHTLGGGHKHQDVGLSQTPAPLNLTRRRLIKLGSQAHPVPRTRGIPHSMGKVTVQQMALISELFMSAARRIKSYQLQQPHSLNRLLIAAVKTRHSMNCKNMSDAQRLKVLPSRNG